MAESTLILPWALSGLKLNGAHEIDIVVTGNLHPELDFT